MSEICCIERLKSRSDFIKLRDGKKVKSRGFLLIYKSNKGVSTRIGYTVTKKAGNAVIRNRIKRRLKEAIRVGAINKCSLQGYDYNIIGYYSSLNISFNQLIAELHDSFRQSSLENK